MSNKNADFVYAINRLKAKIVEAQEQKASRHLLFKCFRKALKRLALNDRVHLITTSASDQRLSTLCDEFDRQWVQGFTDVQSMQLAIYWAAKKWRSPYSLDRIEKTALEISRTYCDERIHELEKAELEFNERSSL